MTLTTAIRCVLESVTHAPCRTAGAHECLLGPIRGCTNGLAGLRELADVELRLRLERQHLPPPPRAPTGTCCRDYPTHAGVHPEAPDCELWEADEPHHTPGGDE